MRIPFAIIGLLALAACQTQPPATSIPMLVISPPDLSACQANPLEPINAEEFGVAGATPVPEGFGQYVATDETYIAVSSYSGGTTCADNRWTGEIVAMEWFAGERIIGWQWWGYEAFGYFMADRSGDGSIMDVGARPHFSPSGNRMAALQVSDAGWGGMEGFAVWQVTPDGFERLSTEVADEMGVLPQIMIENYGTWAFVGWRGEDCMQMSLDPYETPDDTRGTARRIYYSAQGNGWQIMEGRCS